MNNTTAVFAIIISVFTLGMDVTDIVYKHQIDGYKNKIAELQKVLEENGLGEQ